MDKYRRLEKAGKKTRTAPRKNQWNSFTKTIFSVQEQKEGMIMVFCLWYYNILAHGFLNSKSPKPDTGGHAV